MPEATCPDIELDQDIMVIHIFVILVQTTLLLWKLQIGQGQVKGYNSEVTKLKWPPWTFWPSLVKIQLKLFDFESRHLRSSDKEKGPKQCLQQLYVVKCCRLTESLSSQICLIKHMHLLINLRLGSMIFKHFNTLKHLFQNIVSLIPALA